MIPCVIAIGVSRNCKLGEGPHWDSAREELLYVDILEHCVYRYVPKDQKCFRLDLGEVERDLFTSIVIPVEGKPNKYIVTSENNVKLLDWDGESSVPNSLKTLFTVDQQYPEHVINDGKCDARGRLFAGTFNFKNGLNPVEKLASLYSFGLDGNVKTQISGGLGLSNGLAWSADNKTFYYIESFNYRVDAYDYDLEEGMISNRRTVFDFKAEGEPGLPDGMTIDNKGNLWIASFGGQGIVNIDSRTGKKIGNLELPHNNVTSVAFGGRDLDTLYVTTTTNWLSEEEMKAQPDVGKILEVKHLGVKGVPMMNFMGPI